MQRFAITNINSIGLRTLTFANQSRNHYATFVEAEEAMQMYAPELQSKVLGDKAGTLQVREVDCYDNGDAKGIYFDSLVCCVCLAVDSPDVRIHKIGDKNYCFHCGYECFS